MFSHHTQLKNSARLTCSIWNAIAASLEVAQKEITQAHSSHGCYEDIFG